MIGALWTGISGLASQQTALDNESNNIANVNTVGYKASRVSFADLMYQDSIGKGSSVTKAEKQYTQGSLNLTGSSYDVALNGDGFFVVSNKNSTGSSESFYTRAGNFRMGDNGTLQDAAGNEVQGWALATIDATSDVISTNSNLSSFTDIFTQIAGNQIIQFSNKIETYAAKMSDYSSSAKSDSTTLTGSGIKTQSAKISDIEALITNYSSALSSYATDPESLSSPSMAQSTVIDFPDGTKSSLNSEGDQIYVYINGNKYTQDYVNTTASDEFKTQFVGTTADTTSKLTITPVTSTGIYTFTPTVVNNTKYSVTIGSETVSYSSDADATTAEILAGLQSAISGMTSLSSGATFSNDGTTLTLSNNLTALSSNPTVATSDTISKLTYAAGTSTGEYTFTPTVENNARYSVTIGTETVSYDSDADATAAEIIAGLQSAISSGITTLDSGVTFSNNGTTLTLSNNSIALSSTPTVATSDTSSNLATIPASSPTGEYTLTPTLANNTRYTMTIGSETVYYDSDSTATTEEILNGLIEAINDGITTLYAGATISSDGSRIILNNNATLSSPTSATYKSKIDVDYDVAASRIETYKALADQISTVTGLKAYTVSTTTVNGDSVYDDSTFNSDVLNGTIKIDSLIPGTSFTIGDVSEVSGITEQAGSKETITTAVKGTGESAVESAMEALRDAVAGNQQDVYEQIDITSDDNGNSVAFSTGDTISFTLNGVSVTSSSTATTYEDAMNDLISKINSDKDLQLVVEAKNINGNLVIQSKEAGVEFSGVIKYTDASSSTTYAKEKNLDLSGNTGAGAEFMQIISKIDQTASKSSLQLKLDTLGLTDSSFGEFSVDSSGVITMKQDGVEYAVGQLAIAQFNNNIGLKAVGDNLLAVTNESGDPIFSINNDNGTSIESETLELSTADLSESLVNLMVFQRAFEANAKSITTADEILNTLINLKR